MSVRIIYTCRTTHGGVASAREGICRPARQMRRPPQRYRRETHNNECHRIFLRHSREAQQSERRASHPPPDHWMDWVSLSLSRWRRLYNLSSSSAERVKTACRAGGKERAKPSDIDGRCGSRNCKPASTIAGSQRRFSVHAFVGLFNDDLPQNTISSTPAIFTRSRSTRAVRVAFLLPPAFKQNNLFPTKQNKRAAAEGHKQFPQGPPHTEHTPSHTYHTTLMAPLLFFFMYRDGGAAPRGFAALSQALSPRSHRHWTCVLSPEFAVMPQASPACVRNRAGAWDPAPQLPFQGAVSSGFQVNPQNTPSQATLFPPQQADQRMRMLGVSLPRRIACPLPSKITLDLHGGDHIDNNKTPARQGAPATKSLPNRIPVPYLQSESGRAGGRAGPEKSAPLFESPSPRPTSPFRDHAPSSPCQLKQTGVALPDAETDAPVATSRGHDSRPTSRSHRCDSKKNATHEQGMLE